MYVTLGNISRLCTFGKILKTKPIQNGIKNRQKKKKKNERGRKKKIIFRDGTETF